MFLRKMYLRGGIIPPGPWGFPSTRTGFAKLLTQMKISKIEFENAFPSTLDFLPITLSK